MRHRRLKGQASTGLRRLYVSASGVSSLKMRRLVAMAPRAIVRSHNQVTRGLGRQTGPQTTTTILTISTQTENSSHKNIPVV